MRNQKYRKFKDKNIEIKLRSYPIVAQNKLMDFRELIFQVAEKTNGVGELEETLKWNELSFMTNETKSGSTFRIDWKEKEPDVFHIYFNCNTKLIHIFKELFPNEFNYGGNRSISLKLDEKLPKIKISKCIEIALTYKLRDYKNFLN